MRRIFIVGEFSYPHGNASANYVQYLSDALILAGYKVEIICKINEDFSKENVVLYHGAHIHEMSVKKGSKIKKRICNGRRLFRYYFIWYIRKFKPCRNDVFLTFGGEFIRKPLRFLRNIYGFKLISCPLEWFGREQFESDKLYFGKQREFELIHKSDAVFPISHNIAEQFPELPKLIIPPMVDVQEYDYTEKREPIYPIYNIILPANGLMKDSFESMIKGFSLLTDLELKKVVFHIKGVKENTIIACIGNEQWNRIKPSVVLHEWMQYEELISLYREMHFLILARGVSQMTLSNFPSKVPETMSYGIVPIVSKVGDYTQYYLKDGINSLIFEGCSAEDCCLAYRRAISLDFDSYRKLSHEARICAESKFDYRNWMCVIRDAIESLYD